SSAVSPGSQYSRSQEKGSFTRSPRPLELPQKAHVVLVEHPQVGHAVLEEGNALDPHAEGEALDPLGVVAAVLHEPEHVRVDHARTEDLDPARALADAVARAVGQPAGALAAEAGDVDLHAGLGEGEEV